MRWVIAALICLLAACRHQPLAYTLTTQGRNQVLAPPPSKPEVKSARRHPTRKSGCDIESDSLSVTWHGNTARVGVKSESYYAAPAAPGQSSKPVDGVTISESGPRIYTDSIEQLDKFREALEAREDSGCIRGDEGPRLRQAITETFPFPPGIVAYLRFGAYTRTSYFDLTTEFLIRTVTPPVANPDISTYAITRAPAGNKPDDRMTIKLVSGGGTALQIPETPGYFRYLYRTSGADHNFLATILGARDRPTLRDATSQFLTDPDRFCATPPSGVFCRAVRVGTNAGFYVKINGEDGFVRLGGTVGEALSDTQSGFRAIGGRRAMPQVQSVKRLFHGKPIPIKFEGTEILSLVMMPGDEISF